MTTLYRSPRLQWHCLQWHPAYSDTFGMSQSGLLLNYHWLQWQLLTVTLAYCDTSPVSRGCHCKRGYNIHVLDKFDQFRPLWTSLDQFWQVEFYWVLTTLNKFGPALGNNGWWWWWKLGHRSIVWVSILFLCQPPLMSITNSNRGHTLKMSALGGSSKANKRKRVSVSLIVKRSKGTKLFAEVI